MPGSIKNNAHIPVAGSVRGFDNWSYNRLQTLPLSVLGNTVLGIDATSYIHRMIHENTREPLLPALGGFPLAFRANIERDLTQLLDNKIKPLFVFDGLKLVQQSKPRISAGELVDRRQEAWNYYQKGEANEAVHAFGQAISLQPSDLYKRFMQILIENDVEYQVAPYSSWAQLIYLERHPNQYIDAIYGPAEVFFGDVEKVITGLGNGTFSCLNKKAIMQDIGGLNHDQFIDSCLLAGSDLCETFPPLDTNFTFKNALDLMKAQRTIDAIMAHFKDNAAVKKSDYLEKYRKAKSAIRYHIILNDEGKVEPMHLSEAPKDIHVFIGERLPDEVYFYLSRGVMGSQVLDMLVSQKIVEDPPLDNGDGEDYRKFLEGLQGIRTQSLALLSQPLHRFWSARTIDVIYWYDESKPRRLAPKDLLPTPYDTIMNWNVKEADFLPLLGKSKYGTSLTFAVTALATPDFPTKTIAPKNPDELLKTTDEVVLNTFWRTLQLRSFVNAEHKLTPWGRCLEAALSSLNPLDDLEEACYLAVELIRARSIKPDYTDDQGLGLMVKVASLANIRHKGIGYTGPLSRELLGFNSIVRPMARSIRNLSEMVLVSLLLNGDATKRERTDWHKLGLQLGYAEDINAGLGIAIKTYFDELATNADPTSTDTRLTTQYQSLPNMLSQAENMVGDLDKIFRLWDAVIVGIKAVSKDNIVPESQKFLEADEWIKDRRPPMPTAPEERS